MILDSNEYKNLLDKAQFEWNKEYAIIYSPFGQETIEGYDSRERMFKRQKELSTMGLWSISFELRDRHIVAYLQGFLFNKNHQ